MIKSRRIKNFRSLGDVDLALGLNNEPTNPGANSCILTRQLPENRMVAPLRRGVS